MTRIWKNIRRFFTHSKEGSVMPLVGLGMFVLVGATGVAIDMGRQEIVQSRLQNALDSAGLAAGTAPSSANLNTVVNNYFYANFPASYLGVTITSLTVTPNATNTVLSLSVSGTLNTTFMNVFHIMTLNVGATSQITKQSEGMELVLVLDNTGSMSCYPDGTNCSSGSGSKIVALKTAVTGTGGLLDILYGGSTTTVPNLWIGVVPFTDVINIGTAHTGWMDTTHDNALDFGAVIPSTTCPTYTGVSPNVSGTHSTNPSRCAYTMTGSNVTMNWGPANWEGCVNARSASSGGSLTEDESDDPPTGSGTWFQAFNYSSDFTNMSSSSNKCSGGNDPWSCHRNITSPNRTVNTYDAVSATDGTTTGPNYGCINTQVMGMTATKSNIVNLVNSMTANGSTMINLGMAWGWRMLSPRWAGIWGGEMDSTGNANFPQLPLPYHTAKMQKVVILMTDGMNDNGGGAKISGYQGQSLPSNANLDTKTLDICTQLKNNGVIIYTIGFGSGSQVNTSLLTSCATSASYFFLAPTNAELATAFQQIGNSLANLFISH
jgi:Flp pilus assembly protein TadG